MEPLAALDLAAPAKLSDWKQRLAQERDALERHFAARGAPRDLLRRLCALVDRHLREVWQRQNMPSTVSLLAVGGYGRGELYPYSDVDLLILLPTRADAALQRKLEDLVGVLWDIGLEVGHSVRTIDECTELAAQDITVQTTLLESRLLAGHRGLFRAFVARTSAALDPRSFLQAKELEQQQRHARHQATNLEPNVKESAGGLRDLQTILWIARAARIGHSWTDLARRGVMTTDEARELRQQERFLQALRIRLHYVARRREDRLLFDHQSQLAGALGLKNRPHRLASEQLM